MAERRMFAKTIITSDAFLDMPASARCLYFLLGMMADDDGFVNAPRSIMRQSGASLDDLNLLIAKRFILTFESGVVVIKHWRIHNLIQKDRYKETKYLEEKSQLVIDDKNAYTEAIIELEPECIQPVSNMEPQVRLGKDRIGKDRLGEEKEETDAEHPAPAPSVPYETIKNLYNTLCPSFSRCTSLSDARKKAIKARFNSGYTVEDFEALFTKAEASRFLKGRNDRNWSANFDWLIKDANMAKVLDGNYDDHGTTPPPGSNGGGRGSSGWQTSNPFMEMLDEEMRKKGGGHA